MTRALLLAVLLLTPDEDTDKPLAPGPTPATHREPSLVPNAVAFAFLGPAAVADLVLLAGSRTPMFAVFAALDAWPWGSISPS